MPKSPQKAAPAKTASAKPAAEKPAAKEAAKTTAKASGKGDHVFLVDGSSYIFRAYWQSMNQDAKYNRRSDGLPTGAVRMFCIMLWRILAEMKPDIAWPDEVQAVMGKALEREPRQRYATTREFGRALHSAIEKMPVHPSSVKRTHVIDAAALDPATEVVTPSSTGPSKPWPERCQHARQKTWGRPYSRRSSRCCRIHNWPDAARAKRTSDSRKGNPRGVRSAPCAAPRCDTGP